MAFKIAQKIKPEQIQDRSLDMGFIAKYLKQMQQMLVKKTTPETPTDYFFCMNYTDGKNLLILGNHAPAYKKVFKELAKGKHGFDKGEISIGKCFTLRENGATILCIQHNGSMSKGKKGPILKEFKKLQRTTLKLFKEVRWMDGAVVSDTEDKGKVETVSDTASPSSGTTTSTGTGEESAPLVSGKEVVTRIKQLQQGVDKLKKDVLPRFKKRQTSAKDAEFVKALRKAASIVLTKITQTDEKTANQLDSQKQQIEKALPQWKDLEAKIVNLKSRGDEVDAIKGVIKEMNEKRAKIKEILKRVNLKAMA